MWKDLAKVGSVKIDGISIPALDAKIFSPNK